MAFETLTFRPRKEFIDDYDIIADWCYDNDSSFCSVINSFLPAIAYALQNQTFLSKGVRYINADFGDVPLIEPNYIRKLVSRPHRKLHRKLDTAHAKYYHTKNENPPT